MDQYGALISKHGTSKFYVSIFLVPALAFFGVGAFVLYTITLIGKGGLSFDGDVSILYATGFGLMALAVAALVACYMLLRTQPIFYLYENAIRAVGKGVDRTDKYEDIEDLFAYVLNQFCYRSSADVPWIFGDARRHRFKFLNQTFQDRHAECRGEKLLQAIRSGQPAIFRALPEDVAWSKSFIRNSRNMNFPLSTIKVTRHHLTIGDKSIPISRIADLKTNVWTESIKIVDIEGKVFHKTHCTAIMSFGALYYILVNLQGQEEGLLAVASR